MKALLAALGALGGYWLLSTLTDPPRAPGDRLKGGLADTGPPPAIEPRQVLMGIEVEMEHTNDPLIAQEIAYDHLMEDPFYYDHLLEMEEKYQT